jgi:hypothetical protein
LIGPRQSGKTTLAKQTFPTWNYIDLERPQDYERLVHNPDFFFSQYSQQLIIDEAQLLPVLFSALRGVIDEHRQQKGRFILTGSSNPQLLSNISETLAGRIATIELGTLKANEFFQRELSPFYQIFQEKMNKEKINEILLKNKQPLNQIQMAQHFLQGGYPEPIFARDHYFYDQWMENYRINYVNRDLGRLFPRLNKVAYQRFLNILSQLSGTIINKSQLARDIEVDEKTVREYMTIAEGTFLWRSIPSYEKSTIKSMVKLPKGYIRDSGLLNYLLRIRDFESLNQHVKVGNLFEAFVIEEIHKGIEATGCVNWQASYYRTRAGAEIDLILEGYFGTVPIEIKYGSVTPMKQLATLREFVRGHQLPYGILINQCSQATWLCEEIIQIPVGWV